MKDISNITGGGGSVQPQKSWSEVTAPKSAPPLVKSSPPSDTSPKTTTSPGVTPTVKPKPGSDIGTEIQHQQIEQGIEKVSYATIVSNSVSVPKPKGLGTVQSPPTPPPEPEILNFAGLLDKGKISHAKMMELVPEGTKDTFIPSRRLPDGEKYCFSKDGIDYEVKFHGPDPYGGPNSSSGWTAQITIDGMLMTDRGNYRYSPNNWTHIPLNN